jgi:DNA-binding transcriptional ArsR family regulator
MAVSSDARLLPVEIEAAPAYELILSLAVACDIEGRGTYEAVAWLKTAWSDVPALLDRAEGFCGGSDLIWAHVLTLAYECPPPRDVPVFLDCLEGVEPLEIRLRLLGYYVRSVRRTTPPETILAAARGDPAAQREMLRTSRPEDVFWRAALRALLPLDPQTTKERLLALLREWNDQVFRSREHEWLASVQRETARLRTVVRERSPEELLGAALPGIDYVPEPGIERVVLIPSVVLRPQVHSFEHHNLKVFAVPVADESLSVEGDAPSPGLVRLLKALADERRLRVLKRLAGGSYTLAELAEQFGVGSTTMFHHMVILRAAGLVRLRSDGGKRYSLRRDFLPEVSELLERYLEDTKS